MERTKIKMIWYKINKFASEEIESAEDSKEDGQLTERQRETNHAKMMLLREEADERTRDLEALFEPLIKDEKQKQFVLKPITVA